MPRALLPLALLIWSACHTGAVGLATSTTSRRIDNLHAFARLYGVVRWFHPSDAAAAIDWDRFAIEGVRRVIDSEDTGALRRALAELFTPMAPTVHVVRAGEPFPDEPALQPAAMVGLDVVAWQHKGYGDSSVVTEYASKRRHRDRLVALPGMPYGAVWQAVAAMPYRGARVRLRGKLRTERGARGQLWLRVERQSGRGFFDNMDRHPVISATWKAGEIVGTIAPDATRIVVGTFMSGLGTSWYDDIELAVELDGSWQPIALKDPGFESANVHASWQPGNGRSITSLDGWRAVADTGAAASGRTSLRVEALTKVDAEELFSEAPAPGETVDIELGSGLRARVPIALYSREGRTVGDDPEVARRSQTGTRDDGVGFDAMAGIADTIVVWNVLQHFWPYWGVVPVDWLAQLDVALRDGLDDRTVHDHVATLERLHVAAPDAHARVSCGDEVVTGYPPFAVEFIEDQVVVTASSDKAMMRGDVVVSVDGRPASAELASQQARVSGSPQWRRLRALDRFGAGPVGSRLTVQVRRGHAYADVSVTRGNDVVDDGSRAALERFDDGVYYVDLGRASVADITAIMDRLAIAPGIVFDLRRSPNDEAVLSHLLTQPANFAQGMSMPRIIRPDHLPGSIPGWQTYDQPMPVRQPHINGRIAFVTGPRAVSYAESVVSVIEHHRLGAIVGSATAGTNGNIAEIATPSGCRTVFTGLRVTRQDGGQLHMVGIQPTVPATRTIAGVMAGRDELLEVALAHVRATR